MLFRSPPLQPPSPPSIARPDAGASRAPSSPTELQELPKRSRTLLEERFSVGHVGDEGCIQCQARTLEVCAEGRRAAALRRLDVLWTMTARAVPSTRRCHHQTRRHEKRALIESIDKGRSAVEIVSTTGADTPDATRHAQSNGAVRTRRSQRPGNLTNPAPSPAQRFD